MFYLKVSRPGLWFPTVWLYLLPVMGADIWDKIPFWIGLLFVTFPLNFLVYGWNDMADYDIDHFNQRKDTYLFGARGEFEELQRLPMLIAITQLISGVVLVYFSGWEMIPILLGVVFFCWIYNAKDWGLRTHPPFELVCQAGYLLVLPLSCLLNQTPMLGWQVWVYLFLFCSQSQLIGEVMDIEPDREGGRRTIATVLGKEKTKILIIAVVLLEAALVWHWFSDIIFSIGLCVFALWLCLDRFVFYRNREYTMLEFMIFGVGSNLIAVMSMIYVWNTQLFLLR